MIICVYGDATEEERRLCARARVCVCRAPVRREVRPAAVREPNVMQRELARLQQLVRETTCDTHTQRERERERQRERESHREETNRDRESTPATKSGYHQR